MGLAMLRLRMLRRCQARCRVWLALVRVLSLAASLLI